jgi:hypothetical protein
MALFVGFDVGFDCSNVGFRSLVLLITMVGVDGSVLVDGVVDPSRAPMASRVVGAPQER